MKRKLYYLKRGENQLTTTVLRNCSLLSMTLCFILTAHAQQYWQISGQNLQNTRFAKNERTISVENVSSLKEKWVFTTEGDVSATPAVDEQAVYFPDWKGNLFKVNATNGEKMWGHTISYYTGVEGDFARATPAISGSSLIIGTEADREIPATLDGAHILNINKNTGELKWMTLVDSFPYAVITQSAVVYGNRVYVGVSSIEEGAANDDTYDCCHFRGSMLALDINTGEILWQTYMTPAEFDFPGNAIWGSTPVIDPKRGNVYVTTGNNYDVPQAVKDCVAAGGTDTEVKACIDAVPGSKQNYFDAIVAMDLKTGAVKWFNSVIPFDAWNVACLFENENCPEEAGPDYDFGQGPSLFTVSRNGVKRDLLGAGQKSGTYWAFNPDNGNIVWQTDVGPGGTTGGLQWGSAVDGFQVYTAVANSNYLPYTLTKGPGRGRTVNGGFWASLDAWDGEVLWEVAGENPPAIAPDDSIINPIARNYSPVTVVNGVVFAGAMDSLGTMYAFDANSGKILWSFESGGSVVSGAAIVDGVVYWGSGYENIGGTPNNKFYAFEAAASSEAEELMALRSGVSDLELKIAPNPFINTTDIQFELTDKGHVAVEIFDQFGKHISTLINEDMEAGHHEVNWNAGDSPVGQYLVRIVTSTDVAVHMINKVE